MYTTTFLQYLVFFIISEMKVKVQNFEDNIPDEDKLSKLIRSILYLQRVYDIPSADIKRGDISGQTSLQPLSLDESFEIARAAYGLERHHQAVDWLNLVTSQYAKEEASFSLTTALNMLSASYMMVGLNTE